MPRFEFRLQTLLKLREARQAEARRLLAESLAAQGRLEERKGDVRGRLDEARTWGRAGLAPGRVNLDGVLSAGNYETSLRGELDEVAAIEAELDGVIRARQQAVAESDAEVRSLEKLRERQLEAFRRQQALAEIKVLDEAASRPHAPA